MPAYFVVSLEIHDKATYKQYVKGVHKTIAPFGGKILAGGPAERLEGDEPTKNQNVIIEFPDVDNCKGWWHSPAYREIVPIRESSSSGANPMVLPGLPS